MKGLAFATLMALAVAPAQQTAPTPAPFHWHDDYTEYHLLLPDEANAGAEAPAYRFRIVYHTAQRQPGLTYVLNQTRSGSAGSGISVTDPRTGEPLTFDYMTGKALAAAGVTGRLAPEEHYIHAHLARPVPAGGEGRVRIEKTYADAKSYFKSGETITFARSLGIGRNAIVLPVDYKLVSSNVAGIIESLGDGRVRITFENMNGYASDVNIRAAKSAAGIRVHYGGGATPAFFSRKTLYELRADGTVRVTHDHTGWGMPPERGPSSGLRDVAPHMVPLVPRPADMRATDMDTGEELTLAWHHDRGVPTVALKPAAGEKIMSAHIRLTGTLRDPKLVIRPIAVEWSRELLEPRATIVLPAGYELAHVNVPVTTGALPDGRAYVQVVNTRPASMIRLEVRGVKTK